MARAYDSGLDANPDSPALITGGVPFSYAELRERADATAGRLAALGVGEGDRVAVTLPPGVDFAALIHAMPLLGAVLVPLNTRLTAADRRWQLADSGARVVVDEPLAGERESVEPRTPAPDSVHAVLYTSGTTARPKPVSLTYGNIAASARASAANLGVDPADRWLCVLPLFHVGGLSILWRSAIYGTAAILHDGFDADRVGESLESGEATLVSVVSTMLRRLQARGLSGAPALRAALVGGGPVPRDLLDWAAGEGLPLLQTYGMTETASQIATLSAEEAVARLGSAGRPLPGVELRIGAEGEILVRGPMVSPSAIGADGWLHTGDRGSLDGHGYLVVEGRIKDTIVTGGENVAAAEVEEALVAHPAVADAAVAGRPDPEWGEVVTAFVVLEREATDAELTAHCRERLAGYKVPRSIRRVPELPRTASGKLLKGQLPG